MKRGRRRELLKGGRAAGRSPSEFSQAAIARGIQVELEHTPCRAIAREIAMDHLSERPDYYEVHARAGLNPVSMRQVREFLDRMDFIERAPSLEDLADRLEWVQSLESETLRGTLSQAAIRRAKTFGFRTTCNYPPEDCAREIVEFVRSRQQTLFNPKPPPSEAQVARRMREHCRFVAANGRLFGLSQNPTSVARVGGLTIMVFDEDGGAWAQVYDEGGPRGARWYGDTAPEALEIAVERAHDFSASESTARGLQSPGDAQLRAQSRKAKLLR